MNSPSPTLTWTVGRYGASSTVTGSEPTTSTAPQNGGGMGRRMRRPTYGQVVASLIHPYSSLILWWAVRCENEGVRVESLADYFLADGDDRTR